MDKFAVGTELNINDKYYRVLGYIIYACPEDGNKTWTEYRLIDDDDFEYYLSVDEIYQEFSLSEPTTLVNNTVPTFWNEVDSGHQQVLRAVGDVDVDVGEIAEFIEYEDDEEEEILSLEIWDDGTEVSCGKYIEQESIKKFSNFSKTGASRLKPELAYIIIMLFVFIWESDILFTAWEAIVPQKPAIEAHFEQNSEYQYLTSITGKEKEKAKVYQASITKYSPKIDNLKVLEAKLSVHHQLNENKIPANEVIMDYLVKKLIIELHSSNSPPITVTANEDENGLSVAVLTDNEYCLFYHPEDKKDRVYVQLSSRKYNYSSDNKPYHAHRSTYNWYRSHYYNSGYQYDAKKWGKIPSSYTLNQKPIVRDLGNGYYDVYSSDIKRSSIGNRRSSSGGLSMGK